MLLIIYRDGLTSQWHDWPTLAVSWPIDSAGASLLSLKTGWYYYFLNPIVSISYFQEHIVVEPCNVLDWQTWPTNLRPNPTLGGVDKRLLILIISIKSICMVCTFAQSESSELSVNIPMTSWITLSSYYITLSLHFRECNWKYACMGDFFG